MAIKKYRFAVVALVALALVAGLLPVAPVHASGFSDVGSHWARWYIEEMTNLGIFNGYPDGTFRPDNSVTRAEFVKIVVEAFDLQGSVETLPFTNNDEVADSWASDYIARAVEAGIIKAREYPAGFPLNDPITRGEIARMVVRGVNTLEKVYNPHGDEVLTDIPAGELGDYIKKAVEYRIVTGYPDGTFKANNTATRAESATMIERAIKLDTLMPIATGGDVRKLMSAVLAIVHSEIDADDGFEEWKREVQRKLIMMSDEIEFLGLGGNFNLDEAVIRGNEAEIDYFMRFTYKEKGSDKWKANWAVFRFYLERHGAEWKAVDWRWEMPAVRGVPHEGLEAPWY